MKLLSMVKEKQIDGKKLGREPFFPFDSSKGQLNKQFWGASMQDLDAHDISLFGTRRSFAAQFTLPAPLYNMYDKALNWEDKKN